MKDNNDHICNKQNEMTIESWIKYLMEQSELKADIEYRCPKTEWFKTEIDHRWDFYRNEYRIIRRRKYIIKIDKEGIPSIIRTKNDWTSSDFGPGSNGSNYILMEEVAPE